jgi:hypothetical protein
MISKVVRYVESGNFKYALRFEEKLYGSFKSSAKSQIQVIKRIQDIHFCSRDTACMIASSSWGYYQILGLNVYSLCGYNDLVFKFIESEEDQEKAFYRFCELKKISLLKAEKNLHDITIVAIQIETSSKSLGEYVKTFQDYVISNISKYPFLKDFITRYNGARAVSNAFFDYLLRMVYYFKKIAGGE